MATLNPPRLDTCSPWATPDDITGITDTQRAQVAANGSTILTALQAASNILYALSGSRWPGLCTETVRPNARLVNHDFGRPIATPIAWTWSGSGWGYFSGGWLNGQYSRWGWYAASQELLPGGVMIPSVRLGGYPVTSVASVIVNGQTVDPSTYRVDDWEDLVRVVNPAVAGDQAPNLGWPAIQRMDLPATEPNTWQVTYTYGTAPPADGRMAAAELGYQLYLAASPTPSNESRLPARVTSIVKNGISAVVLDPLAFIDKGRTGLVLCDLFLARTNPGGLRRRSTVWSPDVGPRVRRTGPVNG